MFCVTSGFSAEYVWGLSVEEFKDLYHSLLRNDARRKTELAILMQNSYHADAKNMKKFLDSLGVWLPGAEKNSGRKSAEEFQKAISRR